MKKTSVALNMFYVEYLAWIEAGAVENETFDRACGLCGNLFDFCEYKLKMEPEDLLEELHEQLSDSGLSSDLPFDATFGIYLLGQCHLNQARIQWVKDRVKEWNTQ